MTHRRAGASGGLLVILTALAAALGLGQGTAAAGNGCATIQGGTILNSSGQAISVGYDAYGYNYQAHSFNGTYDGLDRVLDGTYYGSTGDYVDDSIQMKWSNDWLSNVDCDGDGKLDRSVDGISRGWLTNHSSGDYVDGDGAAQRYTDFVKIGWVGPGGSLWGQYEVLQEVYDDSGGGSFHRTFDTPGLGLNDGWTSA